MLLTVPFAWDEHEAPFDFARYTSYGLRALLERNGFEVLELRKTTSGVRAIGQMAIAYLYQHLSPQRGVGRIAVQALVLAPLTALVVTADRVLPRRDQWFCNSAVLAVRR